MWLPDGMGYPTTMDIDPGDITVEIEHTEALVRRIREALGLSPDDVVDEGMVREFLVSHIRRVLEGSDDA